MVARGRCSVSVALRAGVGNTLTEAPTSAPSGVHQNRASSGPPRSSPSFREARSVEEEQLAGDCNVDGRELVVLQRPLGLRNENSSGQACVQVFGQGRGRRPVRGWLGGGRLGHC